MPTIRERVSDALLHTGTEIAIDRIAVTRGIESAPRNTRGYEAAAGALWLARWCDSAILWLSWRVRPNTFTRAS